MSWRQKAPKTAVCRRFLILNNNLNRSIMKTHHSFTSILVHFIFVTKYRQSFAFFNVCFEHLDDFNVKVIECNSGDCNHIHLILDLHPSLSVAEFAEKFKAQSSSHLRRKFGDLWPGWQRGYYASSVASNSIENLADYIKNQD